MLSQIVDWFVKIAQATISHPYALVAGAVAGVVTVVLIGWIERRKEKR